MKDQLQAVLDAIAAEAVAAGRLFYGAAKPDAWLHVVKPRLEVSGKAWLAVPNFLDYLEMTGTFPDRVEDLDVPGYLFIFSTEELGAGCDHAKTAEPLPAVKMVEHALRSLLETGRDLRGWIQVSEGLDRAISKEGCQNG